MPPWPPCIQHQWVHTCFPCSVGGSIPVNYTYLAEFYPEKRRGMVFLILIVSWSSGIVYAGRIISMYKSTYVCMYPCSMYVGTYVGTYPCGTYVHRYISCGTYVRTGTGKSWFPHFSCPFMCHAHFFLYSISCLGSAWNRNCLHHNRLLHWLPPLCQLATLPHLVHLPRLFICLVALLHARDTSLPLPGQHVHTPAYLYQVNMYTHQPTSTRSTCTHTSLPLPGQHVHTPAYLYQVNMYTHQPTSTRSTCTHTSLPLPGQHVHTPTYLYQVNMYTHQPTSTRSTCTHTSLPLPGQHVHTPAYLYQVNMYTHQPTSTRSTCNTHQPTSTRSTCTHTNLPLPGQHVHTPA